jgi:hypothetical protein
VSSIFPSIILIRLNSCSPIASVSGIGGLNHTVDSLKNAVVDSGFEQTEKTVSITFDRIFRLIDKLQAAVCGL